MIGPGGRSWLGCISKIQKKNKGSGIQAWYNAVISELLAVSCTDPERSITRQDLESEFIPGFLAAISAITFRQIIFDRNVDDNLVPYSLTFLNSIKLLIVNSKNG